jgi:cysteine desulfurase
MRTIYFDSNATTPLDARVRDVLRPFLEEVFGNPSSVHHVGRKARVFLDDARERVAQVWRCQPSEVIFTSGGTESNNLAILGTARHLRDRGRHLIASAVEHDCVLQAYRYLATHEGFELTVLPVDQEGRVSLEALARTLRPDTILVSVMAANNEIGTIQPVAELGALCRQRGICFHTDAVQCFGKEPFASIHQFNADLVSMCAHKLYGPKGAGALFVRSPLRLDPILFGGAHEQERRAGTENLPAIAGLAETVERFLQPPVFPEHRLRDLTDRLMSGLAALADEGVMVRTPRHGRLSNTVAFTVQGCDGIALLAALDLEGICASSGSACSVGSLEPSHVILALGAGRDAARSLVRLSLGRESTVTEVETFEAVLPVILRRARR